MTTTAALKEEEKKEGDPADRRGVARQGLIQAMHNLQAKFSSTPIVDRHEAQVAAKPAAVPAEDDAPRDRQSSQRRSSLTLAERQYLQTLLDSGDAETLLKAQETLQDESLFFPDVQEEDERDDNPKTLQRRDSKVQQELFKLHEQAAGQRPSLIMQRLSFVHRNSLLVDEESTIELDDSIRRPPILTKNGSWDPLMDESSANSRTGRKLLMDWNPFDDVAAWLDGHQGVEVSPDGTPLTSRPLATPASTGSFLILGTHAADIACHPHVLSPPLMEALQEFIPASLTTTTTNNNFWLKYSLVRDGASLWTLLRQVRASHPTFVAIETTDGHVFGSFTSQAWCWSEDGWFGRPESFLWQLRHPRSPTEDGTSMVEQALRESEIQVFHYTGQNKAVQFCLPQSIGLRLGQGELSEAHGLDKGHYHGSALQVHPTLRRGSTSSSETFGNPCLVDSTSRGEHFEIANLEVWTLTSQDTVEAAEQSELSTLFLQRSRDRSDKGLNVLDILSGGPI